MYQPRICAGPIAKPILGPRDRKTYGHRPRKRSTTSGEAWRLYKEQGDLKARDQLILAYSPLVKYVAGRMSSAVCPLTSRRATSSPTVFWD